MIAGVAGSSWLGRGRLGRRGRVVVAGGGLAGLSAALLLSRHGVRVELLETRQRLGGRATSFDDPRSGETLDNCQHVALGCCTNYFAFCEMLGVRGLMERHPGIWWLEAGGRTSVMRASSAFAPAHYAGALLGARFLSAEDKVTIGGAMALALRSDRRAYSGMDFVSWLDDAGVSERARRLFFEPLIVSACNALPGRVSACVGLHVLQEGMLAHRASGEMWVSRVALSRLYDPAAGVIESAGGRVRLGCSIVELEEDHVRLSDGERIDGDVVVSALPAERLARVASDRLRRVDSRLAACDAIEHSPIIGVHLGFDRGVMAMPNAVLVGRETQWLFRKDDVGSRVHAVISGADDWVGLDEGAIVGRVLRDIQACVPGSAEASLVWGRAVKERRATFVPSVEFERVRPNVRGVGSGLVLAGDWVRTGWPATMEGAVRSGAMAAAVAMGLDDEMAFVEPALRAGVVARLFGGSSLRGQGRARVRVGHEKGRPFGGGGLAG